MIIKFIFTAILLMLISGCSNKDLKLGQKYQDISIKQIDDKDRYEFSTNIAKGDYSNISKENDQTIQFINTVYLFDEIRSFGKKLGYKYFVVLKPYNTNNILGSPINNLNQFLNYCFGNIIMIDSVVQGDCKDLSGFNDSSTIDILYLKNPSNEFVTYDINYLDEESIMGEYLNRDLINKKLKEILRDDEPRN